MIAWLNRCGGKNGFVVLLKLNFLFTGSSKGTRIFREGANPPGPKFERWRCEIAPPGGPKSGKLPI